MALCIFYCSLTHAQEAPYPRSRAIIDLTFDTATIHQHGLGSDQWPMTWASDGSMVAAWGDGYGWNGNAETTKKRSIGVSKIDGVPPALEADDTWGAGPGQSFGKPDALVDIDGVLWMFWVNGDSKYDHDTYGALSTDLGETWQLGSERLFKNLPTGFRVRSICQFGQANRGAKDGYVYVYFALNRHPDIYLARVDKTKLFDESSYEWFLHLNDDGSASWTKDHHRKAVAFRDNQAYLWHISTVFHPGLNRILLSKPHYDYDDNRLTPYAPKSNISGLGIFEAPNPWGPWSTVYYTNEFLDDHVKFNYVIPAKYIDPKSPSFWMAWSGWPEYDNVTFIRGTFRE